MAASAALIALLALLTWSAGRQTAGRVLLVTVTVLSLPAAWAALSPGAAVRPPAIVLLAVAAGLGVASLSRPERFGHRLSAVLAAAGGVISLHALYQRFWGFERLAAAVAADPTLPDREAVLVRLEQGRVFAAFSTPAALGGFLALAAPVTLVLALSSRGPSRWAWAALLGLQTGAFLSAASASATAGLIGAGLLAALAWKGGRRAAWAGLAAGLVLLGAVVLLRGSEVTSTTHPNSPWRLRAGNLRAAWSMTADHPMMGVGPGGFSESYPAYRLPGDNETRHVHNLPLELSAELGVPAGAGAALFFFWIFLAPLWRERTGSTAWRRGLAVGLAAFALQNLADFTAFMPSLLWTAGLLRGAIAAEERPLSRASGGFRGRALAGASLAVVAAAALVAAGAGLADNARFKSRQAFFDGDTERALAGAERAARLAPWDPEAALHLGLVTWAAGDRDLPPEEHTRLTASRVDRAVRLSPVRAAARELRAGVRMMSYDYPGAFADRSAAARLYPGNAEYTGMRDEMERSIRNALPPAGTAP